jgi:hypothetical protein
MIQIKSIYVDIPEFTEKIKPDIQNKVYGLARGLEWDQQLELEWTWLSLVFFLNVKVRFEKEYDDEDDPRSGERPISEYGISSIFENDGDCSHKNLTCYDIGGGNFIEIKNIGSCLNIIEGIIENTKL